MAKTFHVEKKWVWCNDSQSLEPRLEVSCGIVTNLGTVLMEKRAFAETMSQAFALRFELDANCLDALQRRSV